MNQDGGMDPLQTDVLVCGAGPAGLAAAEHAARSGVSVTVIDSQRSPGRKVLLAGRSGLNLTHNEPEDGFATRYSGSAVAYVRSAITQYPPEALRHWADSLGAETYAGTSGRVFPRVMRATPLLRAWLTRLADLGVTFSPELRWEGPGLLSGTGRRVGTVQRYDSSATVLAFGGGSWPRTGSDGGWVSALRNTGVDVAPLRATNVGVLVRWTDTMLARYEGHPVKNVLVEARTSSSRGDMVITKQGLEGGPVYTVSREIHGGAALTVNLRPDVSAEQVVSALRSTRSGDTLSNRLRKVGLSNAAVGLLLELGARDSATNPEALQQLIHRLPIPVTGTASLERAISSGGGVSGTMISNDGMLRSTPGVFVAGEMLDWDAPTGGYLLQGCWSTGCRAGEAAARYVRTA